MNHLTNLVPRQLMAHGRTDKILHGSNEYYPLILQAKTDFQFIVILIVIIFETGFHHIIKCINEK